MRNRVFAIILATLTLAPAAGAQSVGGGTAGGGAYFETYDFLDPSAVGVRRISLFSTPLAVRVPVVRQAAVEVRSAFARASLLRGDGEEVVLSGLTDTEVRVNVSPFGNPVLLSAGVLVPTGNATHTLDEAQVAGFLAADLIPFRISNWGTGGGLGMLTSFAAPVGDFGLGLSLGYTIGREFEPLQGDQLAYRPGNEFRARVAVDRTFGASAKASLLVGLQQYREDRFGGESIFRPGGRLEALTSLAFAAGDVSNAVVYAGLQHRGAGRLTISDAETPAQDLFVTGVGARIPRAAATLVPSVDVRVFRRADGLGQGHLSAAGAALEIPAGGALFVPSLRGRFGTALLWEDEQTSLRGAELGLALRMRF